MKHLLSPLDLSVDELDELLNLASDIAAILPNIPNVVTERSLLHFSTNQAQEQDSVLKPQC